MQFYLAYLAVYVDWSWLMKQNTHPDYQEVLFVDSSNGHKFLCGSTLKSEETDEFEGKQYPVIRLPITSASHPFFTGSDKLVDAEGRVEKFRNRYKAAKQKTAQIADLSTQQKEEKVKKIKKK